MAEQKAPLARLREYTGLNISEFARETDISRPMVYALEEGANAGGKVWRSIRARWPEELAELRLTANDFIDGSAGR
jgi:hypothetical protein